MGLRLCSADIFSNIERERKKERKQSNCSAQHGFRRRKKMRRSHVDGIVTTCFASVSVPVVMNKEQQTIEDVTPNALERGNKG